MPAWTEFAARRRSFETQLFSVPGATRTIMVCSHIWWTDQIAFALINSPRRDHNVLLYPAFYHFYTDEAVWPRFDEVWDKTLQIIRDQKVDLILAGNSSGICIHPKTGELLHNAAGIPAVHYWWDEPRTLPPFAARLNASPDDYLRCLRDPKTLNAVWDRDMLEELAAHFDIRNTVHVPLATLPEYWPSDFVPLENRVIASCFLGNCHFDAARVETDPDPLSAWARAVVTRKIADLDASMQSCIEAAGAIPLDQSAHIANRPDAWSRFMLPWEELNAVYMHRTRNLLVQAAAKNLKGMLALIGKGWEKLGLRANSEHAGEKTGMIYAQSQACLNLFGGSVHGGMPLRPFDIAASGGLILTHYNHELPDLFEPGKECLAFRNQDEMLSLLHRVFAAPGEFNAIAQAGRRRVLAEHTWSHRVEKILQAVEAFR